MNNSSIHHSFDIALATELDDVNLAILIHNFQFWIMLNKRQGINKHDDRTWTYQTVKQITSCFPYWSTYQVERLLNKALKLNILKKGNYNKTKFDQTAWYCFVDEDKFCISRIREMEDAKSVNGNSGIAKPIPDAESDAESNTQKEKKEKGQAPSTPAPAPSKKGKKKKEPMPSDPLVERCLQHLEQSKFQKHFEMPLIGISDEDHKNFMELHGEVFVKAVYERLANWKIDKAKTNPEELFGHTDAGRLKNWVIKAVQEDLSRNGSKAFSGSAQITPLPKDSLSDFDEKKAYCEEIRGIVEPYCNDKTRFHVTHSQVQIICKLKDIYEELQFGATDFRFKEKLLKAVLEVFPRAREQIQGRNQAINNVMNQALQQVKRQK